MLFNGSVMIQGFILHISIIHIVNFVLKLDVILTQVIENHESIRDAQDFKYNIT